MYPSPNVIKMESASNRGPRWVDGELVNNLSDTRLARRPGNHPRSRLVQPKEPRRPGTDSALDRHRLPITGDRLSSHGAGGSPMVGESRQICTLFLLDQSQSIPPAATQEALSAISRQIADRPRDNDLAGLIVFGKEPRVELPPARYPRDQQIRSITSNLDRQYSDIGSAIQLALGSLPPDTTGRLVLFTDGNQNRGNAVAEAAVARRNGVPIDVVPIEYRYDAEVLVDKVSVPAELRAGDTANLKVVLRSARPATGILRLTQIVDGNRKVLAEERIELKEGLNVKFVKQTIDEPSLSSYEATFEPDADSYDTLARNNTGAGFSWIRGEGRVLLVAPEGENNEELIASLTRDKIAVVRRSPGQLSEDLSELAPFDAIILSNVPAESLGENRQEMIATSVRSLGTGLIMIGGPDSFGPGGYNGSPIERALPSRWK